MLLDSQRGFREVRALASCYLCALPLEPGQARDRDHVPNSALFAAEDREPALILPTHRACNHNRSGLDETITQLVAVLHGRPMTPRGRHPHMVRGTFPDGTTGIGARGLDLQEIIFRWVVGFHAALYREPLGRSSRMTFPPFPEGRVEANRVVAVPVPEVVPEFVAAIKRNRIAGTTDVVASRNGKCRYECVWSQADDGRRFCLWALDLYDWKRLGDIFHFEPRGCVGMYIPDDGKVPVDAALETRLHIDIGNTSRLDPFA
jgi:hypothetical protein